MVKDKRWGDGSGHCAAVLNGPKASAGAAGFVPCSLAAQRLALCSRSAVGARMIPDSVGALVGGHWQFSPRPDANLVAHLRTRAKV